MKTKIFLILLLGLINLKAQSVLTLGAGTTMEIGTGADLCAGSIEGSGQLLGGGTFCGNPTEVESEIDGTVPTEFALNQNFPNPFNPSTRIRYSIPRSTEYYSVPQNVTLKVYDVLGNQVATLVNEEKPAGFYEVEFSTGSFGNASGLTSGIYFYRLQAGSFSETRKMILIR